MDRFYHWLLFEDVYPGGDFVPMAHVGMIPHRILACDIVATKQRWEAVDHPWHSLFFHTRHPDIESTPFAVPPTRGDAETTGSPFSTRTGQRDLR